MRSRFLKDKSPANAGDLMLPTSPLAGQLCATYFQQSEYSADTLRSHKGIARGLGTVPRTTKETAMSKTTRAPFVVNRFAEYLASTENYASCGSMLWQWTGTHWTYLDDKEVERQAYAWLRVNDDADRATPTNVRNATKAAVLHLSLLQEPANDKIVLPARNGYIHIEDGAVDLQPHDKSLGLRHCINCEYEPLAALPTRFLDFIEQILPDVEVRARVQEYIGYMFVPDARFQHAQLWLGSGANGKGTLANIIQALHHRVAAIQMDGLTGFKLAGMIGAQMIYCDEAPQRGINEQLIKTLIAGELVQVDRKYRDPVSVRIHGKWLVLANHFPTISDQSAGFWRRWDVVPFDVTIPAGLRDAGLAEYVIRHELNGVLNWAVEGLLRLLARGRFESSQPAAMTAALKEAKLETNSVAGWWEETSKELSGDARTEKTRAYADYADWTRSSGMTPVAAPKFWKRIREIAGDGLQLKKVRGERFCNIALTTTYY